MSITLLPTLKTKSIERKIYVCGFAFSHDFQKVYLLKKNRPQWQKGLLNGLGGLVKDGENLFEAMSRKFHEECGILIDSKNWVQIEFILNESVTVVFYSARLPEGLVPYKTTDEHLWSVYWKNYTQRSWEEMDVVSNVPYLISKAYNIFTDNKNDHYVKFEFLTNKT